MTVKQVGENTKTFAKFYQTKTSVELNDELGAMEVDTKKVQRLCKKRMKELIDIMVVCMDLEKDFKEAEK